MLSVITNFGCDTGCSYCIWKGHKLAKYKTKCNTTDWIALQDHIRDMSPEEISVSGGGDPLFKYEENNDWWETLFHICGTTKVELHTSKFVPTWKHNDKLSRYVLHIELSQFTGMKTDLIEFSKKVKLRLVFVVTKELKVLNFFALAFFCLMNDIELSFRQLVEEGEPQYYMHNLLKKHHKELWYYIEQNDYNVYFMPDNKIYYNYLLAAE